MTNNKQTITITTFRNNMSVSHQTYGIFILEQKLQQYDLKLAAMNFQKIKTLKHARLE
jgi:hypothetical protein